MATFYHHFNHNHPQNTQNSNADPFDPAQAMENFIPKEAPITLTQHILQERSTYKKSTGRFAMLLQSIQLACKVIALHANKAGIGRDIGRDPQYAHETGKKLDELANEIVINCIKNSKQAYMLVSEMNEEPIILDEFAQGYAVVFDPLDGVGNIAANMPVGTIFGIMKRERNSDNVVRKTSIQDVLKPGNQLVCAGYCIYGGSTTLVLTTGVGVNGFILDPTLGEFVLTHRNMKIPNNGNIYSINEGNWDSWDDPTKAFIRWAKRPGPNGVSRSGRYVGSMVADVHRTLLNGGVFCYPATAQNPQGKLRLLYEGSPMAYIVEQAGGKASTGRKRILDIEPQHIHEHIPVFLGAIDDVEKVEEYYQQAAEAAVSVAPPPSSKNKSKAKL